MPPFFITSPFLAFPSRDILDYCHTISIYGLRIPLFTKSKLKSMKKILTILLCIFVFGMSTSYASKAKSLKNPPIVVETLANIHQYLGDPPLEKNSEKLQVISFGGNRILIKGLTPKNKHCKIEFRMYSVSTGGNLGGAIIPTSPDTTELYVELCSKVSKDTVFLITEVHKPKPIRPTWRVGR